MSLASQRGTRALIRTVARTSRSRSPAQAIPIPRITKVTARDNSAAKSGDIDVCEIGVFAGRVEMQDQTEKGRKQTRS